jgi:hypothetical protein
MRSFLASMGTHKTIIFAESSEKAMKGCKLLLKLDNVLIDDIITVEPCDSNLSMDLGVKL